MSLSFSIMSVYEYYYCTKGMCVLCFMHKGMYLISLLIVQKCNTRVGATGPSQHFVPGQNVTKCIKLEKKKMNLQTRQKCPLDFPMSE
jgi:hypothetical protein